MIAHGQRVPDYWNELVGLRFRFGFQCSRNVHLDVTFAFNGYGKLR